jgi:phage tail sheath protein FI
MPDYLSPGVYIEELPPALTAIEGVSTSIAGFVGKTERGPVAGLVPTLAAPGASTAPAASLVTSFADFTRQYGKPLPLPNVNDTNYLAYAVKGFFDNGGSICYVARIVTANATYSSVTLNQGTVLTLARPVAVGDTTIYLNSLRQLPATTAALTIHSVADGSSTVVNVNTYNGRAKTFALAAPATRAFSVTDAYIVPAALGATGPVFQALNPGGWSQYLSISIAPSDRPAVVAASAGTAAAAQITVANNGSFYPGAVIEIDRPAGAKTYHEVAQVLPGGAVQLTAAVGTAFDTTALVRVVEIDVMLSDPSAIVATSEVYRGLSWNPNAGSQHYAAVINAGSNLVRVQPPAGESAAISAQPTTSNGFAISPTAASQQAAASQAAAIAAGAAIVTAVNGLVTAIQAIAALPAANFPLAAGAAQLTALTNAEQGATTAAAALTWQSVNATSLTNAAAAALTAAQAAGVAAVAGGGGQAAVGQALVTAQTAQANATAANTALAAEPASGAGIIGGDGGEPQDGDYVGVDNGPGARTGIQALKDIENISIIAAPGRTSVQVQGELIDQCTLLGYRFAVLDAIAFPNGLDTNRLLTQRDNYDTSYAALYTPWLQITLNNQNVFIPPSGHVIGVYAGTDNSRGVWKAPANVVVQSITGLQSYIVTGEQDVLNPAGVNCIRRFDTMGTRVWGARTISSDDSLIYVNVRRTLIFLEASIAQGTQWVVFEPNNPDTWSGVVDSVTSFLTTQWANGALFGLKPTDSFFVRCDLTTMTADDIQNGRLICMIGVAIVRPAEFVIFRIQQITGLPTQ